ncbi:hypothetical protein [Actinomadura madurae]|uniref:hypothetical protein n=1 Tax=Actinomadura madurae TaxID=1993 RepID=UPI000A759C0A|nr:hypothetical protein [Actinomadura madurae]
MAGYFEDLLAERRRERRDGLTSGLLDATEGDDHLTEAQILIAAGTRPPPT